MKLPRSLLIHEVEIEDFEGDGGFGPSYGDPYTVQGYMEYNRKVVRDREGGEVVSEAQFITRPGTSPPPESKLTLDGNEHEVISVAPYDNPLNDKRFSVEVMLT